MGAGGDDSRGRDRDAGRQMRSDLRRPAWSAPTGWRRGFDAAQAQFLMVTAITHHRVSSPLWGEDEVRKLHAELEEIVSAAVEVQTPEQPVNPGPSSPFSSGRPFSWR